VPVRLYSGSSSAPRHGVIGSDGGTVQRLYGGLPSMSHSTIAFSGGLRYRRPRASFSQCGSVQLEMSDRAVSNRRGPHRCTVRGGPALAASAARQGVAPSGECCQVHDCRSLRGWRGGGGRRGGGGSVFSWGFRPRTARNFPASPSPSSANRASTAERRRLHPTCAAILMFATHRRQATALRR